MKAFPINLFILWLFGLSVILYLGFLGFPKSDLSSSNFFENFSNWDGKYYLNIAKYGYTDESLYAFMPGYPMAIRLFTFFLKDATLSAIFINIFSTLLSVIFFSKLIKLDFKKISAQKVIYAFLFFPTAFFLLMSYSESLFVLLTLLTVYFFRKNNIVLAVIFGFLCTLTRYSGLILILAMLIQILADKSFRKNWIILFSLGGFLTYWFYVFNSTADPLYFVHIQSLWRRSFSLPWNGFWEILSSISQPYFLQRYSYELLNLIFAIFGVGMAIRSLRFLRPMYSFYMIGSILLPLFTSTLSSIPRFLLAIFPLYILIAMWKNNFLYLIYQTISLLLLAFLAMRFFNGYWVS